MVKYRVTDIDGQYRGGLIDLSSVEHEHRWRGRPRDGCLETMLVRGSIDNGSWFLLQESTAPDVTGEHDDDKFDHHAQACRRTIPQALHWFGGQAFGPPPELIERARKFASDWKKLQASTVAQDLLEKLSVESIDFSDRRLRADLSSLRLLRRLDLLVQMRSGRKQSFSSVSAVTSMGVETFIRWMDGHLDLLSPILGVGSPTPPVVTTDIESQFVFCVDEERAFLLFEGKLLELPSSRGLRYLCMLMRNVRRPMSVMQLSGRIVSTGSMQETMDSSARANVRRRIADLESRRDEAKEMNDESASDLDAEIDSLRQASSASRGWGGRPRNLDKDAENARSAVAGCIREAMKVLAGRHQPLHQHLLASLKQPAGWTPCYQPEAEVPWVFDISPTMRAALTEAVLRPNN